MKKTIRLLTALIVLIFALAMFVACTNDEEKNMGTFYSLQEAYDNGVLTVEDLRSVAYYHNTSETEPAPDYPTQMDASTVQAIKEAYAYKINKTREEKIKEEDVIIKKYYGTYHGVMVASITFASKWIFPAFSDNEIAGVMFKSYDINDSVCAFKSNV